MEKIFVKKTGSKKGLKMQVGGIWYITSVTAMNRLLSDEKYACVFSTREELTKVQN